jgi:16S rRNA processing protein RimM
LVETKGPDPETPLRDVRLTVGALAGSHGVRGEIKLRLLTDRPDQLAKITTVYLGDNPAPVRLLGYRSHGDQGLIRIEGVTTPERAKELSGTLVKIAGTDARPLEEGEYFLFQLMGLRAIDENGNQLGVVTDLMETGAHDVLVIARPGGGEDLLVPNHENFVIEVAPDRGEIILRPPVYSD